MSYNYLPLDRKHTSLQQIRNLLEYKQLVSITFDAHEQILACREYLDQKIAGGDETFYGINTGFGYLQNVRVDDKDLAQLQVNLLLSHSCGMGDEVPSEIVKLMLMLKIKSLSYGHSGVQIETVKRLMEMYNADMLPVVYTQGSLGASGDLAPLSHLSLPLIGLGEVHLGGRRMAAAEALKEMNWEPITLRSKEGLALINGTQFMTAYGLHNLMRASHLLEMANLIAALSIDAFDCVPDAFDESIHRIRRQPGQQHTAAVLREHLSGSEILSGEKSQVQDPYSFRCIPQVHGASKDVMDYAETVFIRELNSVTDNPNIFPEEDKIVSGGNFHGEPLAMAADFLSIALSELGSISERRIFQLVSGSRGLPHFLVKNPGLNSGLMITQYTAAGIASENKQLCSPASVDSIPSSNNQEDHVSMGAYSAVKCRRVVDNLEKILAIELLTAAQALEFRRPKRSSAAVEKLVTAVREKISFNEADRLLHTDLVHATALIANYKL